MSYYPRPIFHDDGYGEYLLNIGPRYVNVHENWAGEYVFGPAFRFRVASDTSTRRRPNPVRYRIVVRLKGGAA